jgi:DNA polymerase III subunit delta
LTPDQFLQRTAKNAPAPVYLFIGPDGYQRAACRKALSERLPQVDRFDLDETNLTAVLDDARSLSLFSTERVIWVSGAEAALPKTRAADAGEEDTTALNSYLARPTPGVVLVFDCSRFEFDGEDKAKIERVLKFYAAIPNQVEFRPYTPESARELAKDLAGAAGLKIGLAEIAQLVEALAGDASRIAVEIEKLSLFAGRERKITADDIALLVPNARETTVFALVGSLGRADRKRSLDSLDTLLREGEYLPLALTFLATQFRLAMVAHEANLKNAQQVQTYFTRQGIRIWRDRAEQVCQTVSAFSKERLATAIKKVFWADKALRDARPDDRVVMEELVLALTREARIR